MKPKSSRIFRSAALSGAIVFTMMGGLAPQVGGAPLYWDGDASSPNNTSNNTLATAQAWLNGGNWDNGTTSAPLATWAAADTATFGGTAGIVTHAGNLTVAGTTFSTLGYTLNLTATAATTDVNLGTLSGKPTINTTLSSGTNTLSFLTTNWAAFTGTLNIGSGSQAAGSGKAAIAATANGLPATATVNVNANSTLFVAANTTHAAPITLNGGDTGETIGQLRVESGTWSGNVTLAGAMTGAGDNFVGNQGVAGTISGVIGETGGAKTLSKGGMGVLALSNANTYTGGTVVNAGTLQATLGSTAGAKTIFSTGPITVNSGATLSYFAGSTSNAMSHASNITLNSGTLNSQDAVQTYSGTITLGTGTSAVNVVYQDKNALLTGQITGTGTLAKSGSGTLIVSNAANNYGGNTILRSGPMQANVTNAFNPLGTLTLGEANSNSGTLTINSGFTQAFASISSASGSNGTHLINGAGSLATGVSALPITVNDGTANDDLTITAGITGAGGITKGGAGTLALSGTIAVPVAITAGALAPGGTQAAGTLTVPSLALGTATLAVNLGSGGSDLVTVSNSGGLTATGATTVQVTPLGALSAGTFNLISYSGASPTLAGFTLGTLPAGIAANLTDTGTAIALTITSADRIKWTGASTAVWDVNTTTNWQTVSGATASVYTNGANLLFDDSGSNTTISLGTSVIPAAMEFANTTATSYSITGSGAITGLTGLTKTGSGTLTLLNPNTYTGTTAVNAGTLTANYNAGTAVTPIAAASVINVASGATFRAVTNDANFTLANPLSGSGAVVVDPHLTAGTAMRDVTVNGNNSGFTGTLRLSSTAFTGTGNDTWRTLFTAASALGGANVVVENGAQAWLGDTTFANNFTIVGMGYAESAGGTPAAGSGLTAFSGTNKGGIGALRVGTTTINGNITLTGSAKIQSYGASVVINGNITNTNSTDVLVLGGGGLGSTTILTGNNSGLEKIWVNSGGNSGVDLLQIGATNGGTTGTLGSDDVTLHVDAGKTAAIRFWRSDGYALAPGQDILADTAATANYARAYLMVNTTGTGLTLNGNTVDLSDGTNGGILFVGGNDGATGQLGSILNIQGSSTVDVGDMRLGEHPGVATGIVNQSGGSVSVINNIRVGHWNTTTSSSQYHLSGGSITLSGTPASTPSAGGEQSGGIYIGIDGLGEVTQSGSSIINTKFVVLDNRVASTGNDLLNLNGGTLNLQSQWGIIARHAGSSIVTLNGGSIVNAAASGTAVVIDTPVVVGASGGTLATSSDPLNTLVLTGDWTGNSSAVTGSGKIQFNPNSKTTRDGTSDGNGTQTISTALTGGATAAFEKVGTGTTILSGVNTYSGATTVTAGTLRITGSANNSDVTVADPAKIGGEGSVKSLTFGDTAEILVDPTTPGALTSLGNVTASGASIDITLTGPITGTAPIKVFNFTGTAPTPVLNVGTGQYDPYYLSVTPGNYRNMVVTKNASDVTLSLGNTNLVWTGATDNKWDLNTTDNWNNSTPAPEKFFFGDILTFDDTPAGTAQTVVLTGGSMQPGSITVNNTTDAYTITASAGNVIAGSTDLRKTGTNTLTMAGAAANTFSGGTTISQGAVNIQNGGSLGTGVITLGDGSTGANATALYLDANRSTVANAVTIANFGTTATLGSRATVTGSGDNNKFASITLARDVIFDSNAADRTDYLNIKGSGNITVNGTGRTMFNSANTFTGDITVATTGSGFLQPFAAGSIPDTTDITIQPGANVKFGVTEAMDALKGSGSLSLNTGAAGTFTVTVGGGGGSGEFSGVASNNGTQILRIDKTGSGEQILSGLNTHTGGTLVSGGILTVSSVADTGGSGLGTPSGNSAWLSIYNDGTFRYTGTGAQTTARYLWIDNGVGTKTMDIVSATADLTFNSTGGTINKAFQKNGAGKLTLIDSMTAGAAVTVNAGTLVLTGASVHTAATTLNGGILLANNATGSATGTGAVAVKNTATLGGTGAVTGAVTVESGGKLAPGTSIESLATGALDLQTGSTYAVEINSSGTPAADVTNVTGNVALAGALTVTDLAVTPAVITAGTKLTLITYTGTLAGTFAGKAEGSTFAVGSNTFRIRYQDAGKVTLEATGGYSSWASTNAPTGTSKDDFDGDGVPNGVEYILGGTKLTNDLGKLPKVATSGGNMTFTFIRDKSSITPDTVVKMEVGTTLSTWPTTFAVPNAAVVGPVPGVTVVDNVTPANTQTITLTVPMTPDTKKFGRLSVTITP